MIMSKKHINIKKSAVAVACSLTLAAGAFAPAVALAAGNTGSTSVTIKAETATDPDHPGGTVDQLSFEVPTKIAFMAKANGALQGPAAESTVIKNNSVSPIHVTKIAVSTDNTGWTLVDDADPNKVATENSLSFKLKNEIATIEKEVSGNTWNIAYAGAPDGKDSLQIETEGKVCRVTKDLSQEQNAASIKWTLAAGNVQ